MKKLLCGLFALLICLSTGGCVVADDVPATAGETVKTTQMTETQVETTEETNGVTVEATAEETTEETTEATIEETTEETTGETTVETTVESTEETTEAATEDNGRDYILNTNTKKFHHPSCKSAAKIKASNRKEFHGTREELIAMGYDPCGNCDP